MSAHTPGPWKWFDYPDGRKLLAATNRAVIHCADAPISCEPADERLIAAAPEMLQALREVVGAHAEAGNCFYCLADIGEPHEDDCTMRFVIEAIAKAEDRS